MTKYTNTFFNSYVLLKKVLVYFIMNVLAKRLVQNVVCKVCVGWILENT